MNGTWKNWVLGIVAASMVAGMGINYKASMAMTEAVGSLKTGVASLNETIKSLDSKFVRDTDDLRDRVEYLERK